MTPLKSSEMTPLKAKYRAARILLQRPWSILNVAKATGLDVGVLRQLSENILEKRFERFELEKPKEQTNDNTSTH